MAKFDQSGEIVWTKAFGGHGVVHGHKIIKIPNGYLYGGQSDGVGYGSFDKFIMTLDSDANLVSYRTFGSAGVDLIIDLAQASDGGYLLTGNSDSTPGDGYDNMQDFYKLDRNLEFCGIPDSMLIEI